MQSRRAAALLLAISTPALIGSTDLRVNFDSRILAAHNRERSQVQLPSLSWNQKLADDARVWARHLAITGRFEHSPDPPDEQLQGENLWAGAPGHFGPESMVGLWIAEKRHFKPGVFPDNSVSGRVEDVSHYTQVMWRRTSEVGCALTRSKAEDVLVCRYSGPGNMIGQIPF